MKRRQQPTLVASGLPIPDAVAIKNPAGRVVAWDARAAHAVIAENGQPCPPDCDHIEPADFGKFRHTVGPVPTASVFDEQIIRLYLRKHPCPLVIFGADCWEPLDGCTVVDVVRAAVAEGKAT